MIAQRVMPPARDHCRVRLDQFPLSTVRATVFN